MTPYSRFRMISNVTTTALLMGAVFAIWPVASGMIAAATGSLTPAYWAATAGAALTAVLVSLTISGAVFPLLFRMGFLRRMVLGQHYLEGLWLQAEHDDENGNRLTLIQIRPQGYGYTFSGQIFDRNLNVMSQSPVEMMRCGPLDISYFYATLPGSDGERSDSGRAYLSFRPFRGRALTYTGYGQSDLMRHSFRIEGVKVRKWKELRRLQKRDMQAEILAAYWERFFNEAVTPEEALPDVPEMADLQEAFEPPAIRRPVIVETHQPAFVDRRSGESEASEDGPVIQRRRASDWRSDDTTPTADRIRARMMEDAAEVEEEEEEIEAEAETWDEDDMTAEDAGAEEDTWDAEEAEEETEEEEEYEASEDDEEDLEEQEFEAEEDEEIQAEEEEEYESDAEENEADAEGDKEEPVLIRNRYARR
ncbi:hypothetical protein [Hyphomonas sp.]|uniref:hypothetical protein n=1 Tax=Hyphomonas sp. TaxID=87 RepID=UPI00391DB698